MRRITGQQLRNTSSSFSLWLSRKAISTICALRMGKHIDRTSHLCAHKRIQAHTRPANGQPSQFSHLSHHNHMLSGSLSSISLSFVFRFVSIQFVRAVLLLLLAIPFGHLALVCSVMLRKKIIKYK